MWHEKAEMIGEKLEKQVEKMAQLWQLYQDPGGATLEAGSRWWFKLDGSEWGVDFGTMGVWTPYKDPETGKPWWFKQDGFGEHRHRAPDSRHSGPSLIEQNTRISDDKLVKDTNSCVEC